MKQKNVLFKSKRSQHAFMDAQKRLLVFVVSVVLVIGMSFSPALAYASQSSVYDPNATETNKTTTRASVLDHLKTNIDEEVTPDNSNFISSIWSAITNGATQENPKDTGHRVMVKNLFVDDESVTDGMTFEDVYSTDDFAGKAIIAQTMDMATVYDIGDENFYIAQLNPVAFNGQDGDIIDYAFTYYNTGAEIIDDITYDEETGVAYIPKTHYFDEDGTEYDFNVQTQFLVRYQFEKILEPLEIPVLITDNGKQTTTECSVSSFDNAIAIKIADGDRAKEIEPGDITVSINSGAVEYTYVEDSTNTMDYDKETGNVSFMYSGIATINDISVDISHSTSPFEAKAALSYKFNPDLVRVMPYAVYTGLDLDTMQEGDLFMYWSITESTQDYSDWDLSMLNESHIERSWYNTRPYMVQCGGSGAATSWLYALMASKDDRITWRELTDWTNDPHSTHDWQTQYGTLEDLDAAKGWLGPGKGNKHHFYVTNVTTQPGSDLTDRMQWIKGPFEPGVIPVSRGDYTPATQDWTYEGRNGGTTGQWPTYVNRLALECSHTRQSAGEAQWAYTDDAEELYYIPPEDNIGKTWVRVLAINKADPTANGKPTIVIGICAPLVQARGSNGQVIQNQANMGIYKFEVEEQEGKAGLQKVSAAPELPGSNSLYSLAGAVYGLYSDDACTDEIMQVTTDATGYADFGEMKAGTYYVKEISPSPGFLLDTTIYTLKVEANKEASLTCKEIPALGNFDIEKVDDSTGSQSQGDTTLAGAQFSVKYYKMTEANALADVIGLTPDDEFTVTSAMDGSKGGFYAAIPAEKFITVNGTKGLPLGTYVVEETVPPVGYGLDSAGAYMVRVSYDEASNSAKTEIIVPDGISGNKITSNDTVKRSDLKFTKFHRDKDWEVRDGAGTFNPGDDQIRGEGESTETILHKLPNIVFEIKEVHSGKTYYMITNDEGVADSHDAVYSDVQRDENGNVIGVAEATKMTRDERGFFPYGTYTITELNTPDSMLPIPVKEYNFHDDGMTYTYEFMDEIISTWITIEKKDAEGSTVLVPGAVFELYSEPQDVEGRQPIKFESVPGAGDEITQFTTDATGRIMIPGTVLNGTYYVHEVHAPEGYVLAEDDIEIVVDQQHLLDNPIVTVYEDMPQKGRITITKTDSETGELLPGAVFNVYAAEDIYTGDGTKRYVKDEVVDTITTGTNGKATTKELYLGKYYLKEKGRLSLEQNLDRNGVLGAINGNVVATSKVTEADEELASGQSSPLALATFTRQIPGSIPAWDYQGTINVAYGYKFTVDGQNVKITGPDGSILTSDFSDIPQLETTVLAIINPDGEGIVVRGLSNAIMLVDQVSYDFAETLDSDATTTLVDQIQTLYGVNVKGSAANTSSNGSDDLFKKYGISVSPMNITLPLNVEDMDERDGHFLVGNSGESSYSAKSVSIDNEKIVKFDDNGKSGLSSMNPDGSTFASTGYRLLPVSEGETTVTVIFQSSNGDPDLTVKINVKVQGASSVDESSEASETEQPEVQPGVSEDNMPSLSAPIEITDENVAVVEDDITDTDALVPSDTQSNVSASESDENANSEATKTDSDVEDGESADDSDNETTTVKTVLDNTMSVVTNTKILPAITEVNGEKAVEGQTLNSGDKVSFLARYNAPLSFASLHGINMKINGTENYATFDASTHMLTIEGEQYPYEVNEQSKVITVTSKDGKTYDLPYEIMAIEGKVVVVLGVDAEDVINKIAEDGLDDVAEIVDEANGIIPSDDESAADTEAVPEATPVEGFAEENVVLAEDVDTPQAQTEPTASDEQAEGDTVAVPSEDVPTATLPQSTGTIAVTKTVENVLPNAVVAPGSFLKYVITGTVTGGDIYGPVTFVDTLPAGMSFKLAASNATVESFAADAEFVNVGKTSFEGQNANFEFAPADLDTQKTPEGWTFRVTYDVQIAEGVPAGTQFNTASAFVHDGEQTDACTETYPVIAAESEEEIVEITEAPIVSSSDPLAMPEPRFNDAMVFVADVDLTWDLSYMQQLGKDFTIDNGYIYRGSQPDDATDLSDVNGVLTASIEDIPSDDTVMIEFTATVGPAVEGMTVLNPYTYTDYNYIENDNTYNAEITYAGETVPVTEAEAEPATNTPTEVSITKSDITNGDEIEDAYLEVRDENGDIVDSWISTKEPHKIKGLRPGNYILYETVEPKVYQKANPLPFTVLADGSVNACDMKDEPIKITGEIDKRQTLVRKDHTFEYTIDYRSTSNTWADELNVQDTIDCAVEGLAYLEYLTTPVSFDDWDGKMNVWYKTNKTDESFTDDANEYNALSTNPYNPNNPENKRVEDYTGWKIWKANVSTFKAETLNVADLELTEDEHITGIRFEHGRVETPFGTRANTNNLWDREDRYNEDDNMEVVTKQYEETFDLATAANPLLAGQATENPVHFAPAVLGMKAQDAAFKGNTGFESYELHNTATMNIYRNLGTEPELAGILNDQDEDAVVQTTTPTSGVAEWLVPAPVRQAVGSLAKTGELLPLALGITSGVVIAGVGLFYFIRRRKGL